MFFLWAAKIQVDGNANNPDSSSVEDPNYRADCLNGKTCTFSPMTCVYNLDYFDPRLMVWIKGSADCPDGMARKVANAALLSPEPTDISPDAFVATCCEACPSGKSRQDAKTFDVRVYSRDCPSGYKPVSYTSTMPSTCCEKIASLFV